MADQGKPTTNDSWKSQPIPCNGGLILNGDPLTLGTKFPGAALILQNFECGVDGGYRRINGYTKFDSAVVPGTTNNPILGLKVALGGVFAVRKLVNDNAIYFSTGAGWGSKLSTAARNNSVSKARGVVAAISGLPAVIIVDGANPAWKWDGTTETLINGTGAPANPAFAEIFANRLVLAGYGNGNKISLAAPNSSSDFNGADGAIEVDVGDIVVGMKAFRKELILFCKKYIKKIVGDGSATNLFALEDVADNIGCLSGDTIQEHGGDLVYLSGDTLRSYAATARLNDAELSSVCPQIHPLVADLVSNDFTANQYSSLCVRRKSQYRLLLNDPNNTQADTIGLIGRLADVQSTYFNARNNYSWSTTLGIKPYCADSDYTNNTEIAVIGAPTNGYVYLLESGNTFDGINMTAVFRSPDLTFDDADIRKVFHRVTILGKTEGNFTTTLSLILERGDPAYIQPNTISFSSLGSASLYGTAIYDTDTYGAFANPVFKQNLIGSGFLGAFQFSSTDANSPYTINAYQILFSLKGHS